MASYTSSSKQGFQFFGERTAWAVMLFLALYIGLSTLNNSVPDPKFELEWQREHFWSQKVHAPKDHQFDIVLGGDSRVYRSISPQAIEGKLPNKTVFNNGFSGGGHSPEMLLNHVKLLNTESETPVLVLGLSPYSLTPEANINDHYYGLLNQSKETRFRYSAPEPIQNLFRFFRRIETKRLKRIIKGDPKASEYNTIENQVFHGSNGWVETDWEPRKPSAAIETYVSIFQKETVDPVIIDRFINSVESLSERRIKIFGYRPPSTAEMEDLENRISGYDETSLKQRFEEAGGIWIDIDVTEYESYDGSHLTPASSEKIGLKIADAIAPHL